ASAGALAVLVVPPGTTGRAPDGGRSVVVEAVVAVMVVEGNASDWAGAAGGIGAVLPGEATAGLTTGAAFGVPVGSSAEAPALRAKESAKVVGTEGTNTAERRVAVTEYFMKPLPGLMLAPISVSK